MAEPDRTLLSAAPLPPGAALDADAGRPKGALRLLIGLAVVVVVSAAFLARLHFAAEPLLENDGYFHIKYSYLMAHGEGIIRKLPWLYYTIHRDYYRDHHFLFHVLYIPFTFGDLLTGAKVGALCFGVLMFAVFYLVAARRGRLLAVIASLILLAASWRFIYRMMLPRVPALSMIFLLLGAWTILAGRYRLLALVMFGYVWLYDGFALLIALTGCFFLAEWILHRRANWRLLGWMALGLAAGIVINPYFPRNVSSYLFNFARTVSGAQIQERTGMEWFPLDAWQMFTQDAVIWLALIVALLLGLLHGRASAPTLAFFLATMAGLVFVFKSRRHIEFWPPLVLLFLVWAWADYWNAAPTDRPRRAGAPAWALILLAALTLGLPRTYRLIHEEVIYQRPVAYYRGAARFLLKNAAPRTIVFTGDWDDFPFLFFFNSDCYYVVGLDKLYLKRYDPALYAAWEQVVAGKDPDTGRTIRERFQSRYVVINRQEQKGLLLAAHYDANMKLVFSDDFCTVYEVLDPRR